MNLHPGLLEILVCPACRAEVRLDEQAQELVCQGCGLAYPVRDDIPVMLVEEARKPAPPTRREPTRPGAAPPPTGSAPAGTDQAATEGPGDTPPPDASRG